VIPLAQGLREGFGYAFGFAPIRSILLLLSLMSLAAMPYTILLPVFATESLEGGASTFGLLSAASGAGALAAAPVAGRATQRAWPGALDRVVAGLLLACCWPHSGYRDPCGCRCPCWRDSASC